MPKSPPYAVPTGDWAGQIVAICCGGLSLETQDLALLAPHKIVVVNSSYQRLAQYRLTKPPYIPHADALLFSDERWWRVHHAALKDFAGDIVAPLNRNAPELVGNARWCEKSATLTQSPTALFNHWTSIGGAVNYSAHRLGALNLGAHTGGRIILLGADGRADHRKRTHHHGPHEWPHHPRAWDLHRQDLESLVKPLKKLFDLRIVNASPGSAFQMFPVMRLAQALVS